MNIVANALHVLGTADAMEKAASARQVALAWRNGASSHIVEMDVPQRPARPPRPELLPPGAMPRRRPGSVEGRIALLHAVAHIELNAVDLAFDMIARFAPRLPGSEAERSAFVSDWVGVGDDEARHFTMVCDRLEALGAQYGDLPAHDGLWESAEATAHDVAARLAIAPLVLEARGLDVTPSMIEKLERVGDGASARVLQTIYEEEVGHVACGLRWFRHVADCEERDAREFFRTLVRTHFAGTLKPPFNIPARDRAGLPNAWYDGLSGHQNETTRA